MRYQRGSRPLARSKSRYSTDSLAVWFEFRAQSGPSLGRNWFRFGLEGSARGMFVSAFPAPRRTDKNGEKERDGHYSRNEVKSLRVVSIDLPQIGKEQGSKDGGERPGDHHQAKDRTDVSRAEIVRRKCRGNSISPTVAHHDEECGGGQQRE